MNYGKASCICIKHAVHVNNTGIFEPFSFLISVFSFCETHQRERKPPARSTGWHHSSQSCMPEQRKLERQQERACREKSAASHAMPVQLHRTTCHPMQPLWANKDPFQPSPQCGRAEQKQSVPLGCLLGSDPAFSLLQLCRFVQRSTSNTVSSFWILRLVPSVLKRAWRLRQYKN